MKALLIPLITLLFGYSWSVLTGPDSQNTSYSFYADTVSFDQEKALAELRERIKRKENLPSSEVWKNIQMFDQMPAGRLLRVMEFGYSRSLGVTCDHCHDPNDYASDRRKEKIIAREMARMTQQINQELLGNIDALSDRRAVVNCTTCHRGDIKPATNLD